jgi:hypothetical protein
METTQATTPVANDVLHSEEHSKLSPEEVAKAIAHHNKHHNGDQPQQAAAKLEASKKQAAARKK